MTDLYGCRLAASEDAGAVIPYFPHGTGLRGAAADRIIPPGDDLL
jgi:hypothetical protein